MTTPRKKLIEVALPLEKINVAAAREKSIRHGHPSTLHLWWARRPLAACRAVLFASLVDDPDSDPKWRRPDGTVDEEAAGDERAKLFTLIEDLVQWENSNNPRVIEKARAEIARCVASRKLETGELKKDAVVFGPRKGQAHPKGPVSGEGVTAWDVVCRQAPPNVVNAFLAEHAPPVLDPFCGGGSIPLEAQRLGLVAHASDLNPVAVLITKALIEIPPKFAGRPPVNPEARKKPMAVYRGAAGLAEDVRYYGKWMRDEAEKRIGHLYPKAKITPDMAKERPDLKEYVGQGLTVIAWLWARTVQCPNPACRARTPLVRSFWLSKKKGRAVFALPVLNPKDKTVQFEIKAKGEPVKHTTDRTGARCLFCDTFIKKGPLRDLAVAHGTAEIPLAVVVEGRNARIYLPPLPEFIPAVSRPDVAFLEQPMTNDRRWFSPPLYGMPKFSDLFTPRQQMALTTFSALVTEAREKARRDAVQAGMPSSAPPLAAGGSGAGAYADAIAVYLAFAVDKAADSSSTLCAWQPNMDRMRSTFARHALPMTWDYTETNPLAGAGGDIKGTVGSLCEVLDKILPGHPAQVQQRDVMSVGSETGMPVIATDPPYYDNIGYADLSDFFYVWLRRSLGEVYPELFSTLLTPKEQELIASPSRHGGSKEKARTFFETGLAKAFLSLIRINNTEYPLSVFYAFKQTETEEEPDEEESEEEAAGAVSTGWETMLEGLVKAGFSITGTWPVRSELGNRNIARGTNALASSIVLVCRPRPADAKSATRKQFLTALRAELPDALRNLQRGNIAPVDLAQASIGPGMAVFTRFARVLESDGSPMRVRTALQLINQALDEVLTEQEGEFDADTRWALAWFEQYGMEEGPYGTAETLSKAKNTGVNALAQTGLVVARGGKVRLVKRGDLPADWAPPAGGSAPVWEATQHLIHSLDQQGESAAAGLLRKLGATAETARDLAYRLYSVCERKKWAEEALAYNTLVIAWPELLKLSQSAPAAPPPEQRGLFE